MKDLVVIPAKNEDRLELKRPKIDDDALKKEIQSDSCLFPITVGNCINKPNDVAERPKMRKRKLLLHVDLRNTIIVADSVTNVDVEQCINSYLAGVLWGREQDGQWTWVSKEPSLSPPEPDLITYYKYLERRMVFKPSDRAQLRIATGDFTKQEIGIRFRPYINKYLPMLQRKRSRAEPHDDESLKSCSSPEKISRLVDSLSSDSGFETNDSCRGSTASEEAVPTTSLDREGCREQYHYILPSFAKFLRHLRDDDREFVVIIRTYGLDAPNVLSGISCIVENIQSPRPLPICPSVGSIRRFQLGNDHKTKLKISSAFLKVASDDKNGQSDLLSSVHKAFMKHQCTADNNGRNQHTVCGDEGAYDVLNNLKQGVYALVDDFVHWQNCGYDRVAGKPIWIALPEGLSLDAELRSTDAKMQLSGISQDPSDVPKDDSISSTSPNVRPSPPRSMATSETHHHIFFDDNIRVSNADSIVDVRIYDRETAAWRSTTAKETEACEDVFLVQADLLESLENENYFIEKLKTCEKNFDRLLQSSKSISPENLEPVSNLSSLQHLL